jgi:hypothetical protein
MKVSVQANNKDEARAIQVGMNDPAVRAFVIICGLLEQLPTQRARNRVLQYANDLASDPARPIALQPADDAPALNHSGSSSE